MSQSRLDHAFGVREGYEYVKTGSVEGRVEFHLAVQEEKLVCPACGHGFEVSPLLPRPMGTTRLGLRSSSAR